MSGYRVYETIDRRDIEALFDVGAYVGLVGDASHARSTKGFHLELNLYIEEGQLSALQARHNSTYIKLKPGLMMGAGKVDLEVYSYQQDILELLDSRSQHALRTGRASHTHGGMPGMIALDFK